MAASQQQSPVNGGQTLNTAALAAGIKLAEARRPAMRQLMKQNPAEALAQSLRWDEWAALPAAIQALVEKPFSEIATLSVTPDCRPADQRQTPWQTHRLVLSDSADGLDAFVDGQRQHLTTKVGAPLQGFTLDGQAAIWDSPIYRLGATELVAAQQRFPDGNARDRSWITGQPLSGAATTGWDRAAPLLTNTSKLKSRSHLDTSQLTSSSPPPIARPTA